MPWPGPHLTRSIHKFFVPGPMEMQSSPVLMVDFIIVTSCDNWTWMPSVFGLSPAAMIFTLSTCTFWQPLNTIWNIWLFIDTNPCILILLELVNDNVCNHTKNHLYYEAITLTIITYYLFIDNHHHSMLLFTQ
jgi:hypothetical protein